MWIAHRIAKFHQPNFDCIVIYIVQQKSLEIYHDFELTLLAANITPNERIF